jgi:hypothetical protein
LSELLDDILDGIPAALISAIVSPASVAEVRKVKATLAPDWAMADAIDLPKRRAPPVMKTVLPFKSPTQAL